MRPWQEGGSKIGPEGTGITTIHEYFLDDPWRLLDAFSLTKPLKKGYEGTKYLLGIGYALVKEYPEETYRGLHTVGADIAENMVIRWGLKQVDVVVGKVPTGEYPEFTYKFWTRKEAASGVQRRGLFYTRRGQYPSSIDPIKTTSAQVVENLRKGVKFDTMRDITNLGYEVVKTIGKEGMKKVEEATEKKAQEAIEMAWFTRRRRGYGRGNYGSYRGGYRRGFRRGYSRYGGYRRSYGGYRSRYTPRRRWY